MFKGEAVMLGVLAGAGIFDEHEGKPGRYPDARWTRLLRGGDACEDDRVDAAGFGKLLTSGLAPATIGA